METHQKDIEEKDPFGQNRADDGNDGNEAEKSFLKALLAERALNKLYAEEVAGSNQIAKTNFPYKNYALSIFQKHPFHQAPLEIAKGDEFFILISTSASRVY